MEEGLEPYAVALQSVREFEPYVLEQLAGAVKTWADAETQKAVDAAMDVADAEIRAKVGECARLREELRTEEQTSYALRKEVERLRAELDGVHRALAEERDVAVRTEAANDRLRAALKGES